MSVPDQQAMLSWADGVETLVIETQFEGPGEELAWIVPVPSVPKLAEVRSDFFPTLSDLFAPVFVHRSVWLLPWLCLLVGLTALFRRDGKRPIVAALAAFALVSCGAALVLPAFIGYVRRSSVALPPSVVVHGRERVGAYETATISAKDSGALLGWLGEHGYRVERAVEPVVERYVKAGWVFAALKLRRGPGAAARTHPVAFTFETRAPVYPLMLTGVQARNLEVELFVFGNGAARIEGFEALSQTHVRYPGGARPGGRRLIAHPDIAAHARGAALVTRMRGLLTPQDMQKDAAVRWAPAREKEHVVYTRDAAMTNATNYAGLVWVLALALAGYLRHARRLPQATYWRDVRRATNLAVIIAMVMFAAVTKVGDDADPRQDVRHRVDWAR